MEQIRQIKAMQSQASQIEAEVNVLKTELSNRQKEYNLKLGNLKDLRDKIAKIQNNEKLKVSEHAIIRYFERVKGFNISEIEKEILTEQVLRLVATLGSNGTYPAEGFSVVMKNSTVTTIIN